MATSIGVKLGIDGESEYRKQLNNIVTATKTLDKQMTELQSSFTDETKAMERNEKETELLQKKAEKLNEEVEMMQKAVDIAADKFGEGSQETLKWQQALSSAQTELNKTNAEIDAHQTAAEQMNSSLGQLTEEINAQSAELADLKDAYVNAVLEFGEGSDEANALASEITNLTAELEENQDRLDSAMSSLDDLTNASDDATPALSALTDEISSQQSELEALRDSYIDAVLQFGEGSDEAANLATQMENLNTQLTENKQKLDEATVAANSLAGGLDTVGGSATGMGDAAVESIGGSFIPAWDDMNSIIENAGTAGMIGGIIGAIITLGEEAINTSTRYQQAMNNIQLATLASGGNLEDMNKIARDVYFSMNDTDLSIDSVSNTVGMLNTRLGFQNESLEKATRSVSTFAAVMGIDGASATSSLVDAMQMWGLVTDDDNETIDNMNALMDKLVVAQANADVSINEVLNSVTTQAGAWQSLGYDLDDTIGLLDAYAQAGGNTADITTAVYQTVKNLEGQTDDLKGAWDEAIRTLETSTDRFSTLGTEIGDTGKTIEDVFGSKKAGMMIDVFKDGKVQADYYSDALREAKGTTDDLYESTRTTADMTDKWFGSFDKFFDSFAENNVLVKLFRGEISDLTDKWNEQITTIKNAGKQMDDTSEDMSADISDVRSQLSNPFRMQVTAPVVKYQNYGTNTQPYYYPNVWYETYAKAYDQAMVLSAPTIFGAQGNKLLVGGDRAGTEVVVGEEHLLQMFAQTVKDAMSPGNMVVNVYGTEGQSVSALADAVADRIQTMIERRSAVYA